ncbi:MAG: hypothetical protein IPP17_30395, partial [Bacteroidetes bacterium]|nr:hypothetical protein [Bacteroidota bacterium]
MKALTQISLLLLLLAFSLNAQAQTRGCGTMEHLEMQLQSDPTPGDRMAQRRGQGPDRIAQNGTMLRTNGIVTIPVVVHVVCKFASQNISDAQVQSQIDILNEDFRALNADFANVPLLGLALPQTVVLSSASPSVIRKTSPHQESRTPTTVTSFTPNNAVKFTALGGIDAWDR